MLVAYIVLMALIVGADQLLKFWIVANFGLGEGQGLIPGFLSLQYIQNTGGAFSLLEGKMTFFIIITVIVLIAGIIYLAKHLHDSKWLTLGISLFLAGAVGNFIDRARLGYVVDMFRFDFLEIGSFSFPIFNIADVALVVGVIMIMIHLILEEREEKYAGRN